MRRPRRAPALALLAVLPLAACAGAGVPAAMPAAAPAEPAAAAAAAAAAPVLEPQASGTTALLQAVSVVGAEVAWVSGHRATYARTRDGGRTWEAGRVAGADSLQFRDVHAASADVAWLLSAGPGAQSRIYGTTDGGRRWTLQHTNPDSAGFYDCLAFWDAERGFVYGDAVDGRLVVVETADGGRTWARVGPERLPAAQPGEGGFAASGTCATALAVDGRAHGWIATGNAARPRVLHTADGGRTWEVAELPLAGGEGIGATSVAFRDAATGVALGGDIGRRDAAGDRVALTGDGGRRWTLGGAPTFTGAVYGGAYVAGASRSVLVAVGPGGASWSADDGRSWAPADTGAYWGLGFASGTGWLVGPRGRVVRVRLP
jgi:photosystem II stability/assembly factor-like uncharacterized protein